MSIYHLFCLCLELDLKKKKDYENSIILLQKRINDVCTCFECKVFKFENYRFGGKRWR